uniref:Putative conserved plasma membrane protein n=1 Tax=Amblyomma cajennense TaxID=34607 RepID=A0A023FR98_AMBCJ
MKFISYVSDAVTDNFITRYVHGYTHGPSPAPASPSHELSKPPVWACQLVKSGGPFVRLAGLSGALAVALGAYGAHVLFKRDDVPEELKEAYDRANHYHFLHTLALLGVPLTRRPALVGSLLLVGMGLFCGSCYVYALTGNPSVKGGAPFGGTVLILAWLCIFL